MRGKISVKVRNNKNEYDFTLSRNITILNGRSGSGKTTLYRMIRDYSREGRASGVHVQITGNCQNIMALEGNLWMEELARTEDSVVLVDEDSSFLRSEAFAKAIRGTSNYYLLITRNYLYQLPYSVDEIYAVKGKKKKHFERIWIDEQHLYHKPWLGVLPFKPEMVITEDSHAGFTFFADLCSKNHIDCISADGNSNILGLVEKNAGKQIAVIADGAAFGAEIEELAEVQRNSKGKLALFLPESFEWLILSSGLVCSASIPQLKETEKYVDSSQWFSWEQYFTDLLMQITRDAPYRQYRKDKLESFYLQGSSEDMIKDNMQMIDFKQG